MNTEKQLCIHPDYVQRPNPTHFDDRGMKDLWQDNVYKYARDLAVVHDFRRIVDFGCGSGYKLMKYFSGFETVGYELEPSLSYLHELYPNRKWYDASTAGTLVGDLLICSDVIEHMLDPVSFLEKLKQGPINPLIFSTPALEILAERGWSCRLGPPDNTSHVREWTTREFRSFIEMHFRVLDQRVVNCEQGTQLILAELI